METYAHEWLSQHMVENTQEAIIFADREGMIRLWNLGAETIFGYTASEVLGQSLELIIPERLRDRHRAGYHRVMATGVTRYDRELLAVPATRKDGAQISWEFTVTLIPSPKREKGIETMHPFFDDHGVPVANTIEANLEKARRVMHDLVRLGIRFDCVTWQLQNEGIQKFMDTFDTPMHMREVKGKEKAIVYA